jgi:uncharacterized membrane protein
MSKFLKIVASICLTTPLFVFMSTIGNQPSAHASMKFCNKKDVAVQFAYSRKQDYVPGKDELSDSSTATDIYTVKGWYVLNPGDCVTVSDLSASRDAAPGQKGYFNINHYYHAKTANGNTSSSAKFDLCIKDGSQFQTNTRVDWDYGSKKVKCSEGFYTAPFAKISTPKNNYILSFTGTSSPANPDTCKQGYVWREAGANDRVCVTPEVRTQARNDNAAAASRREPNGGAYGPDTCKQGYVWREAIANDRVCVTPEVRSQAAEDNKRAGERRLS